MSLLERASAGKSGQEFLEIHDNSEIPLTSAAKIIKISSNDKFISFMDRAHHEHLPNLFFISISDKDAKDVKDKVHQKLANCFKDKVHQKLANCFMCRPIILELNEKIYFKEETSFEELENNDSAIGKFIRSCQDLQPENILEEVKTCLSVLSVRLFNILTDDIKLKVELCKYIVEHTEDKNLFYAGLDLPFKFLKPILSPASREIILFSDKEETILEVAIRCKKANVCGLIINNFNEVLLHWPLYKKKSISKLAFDNDHDPNVFSLLIENDFPFPDKFDESVDIEAVKTRRELHNALNDKNSNKVKDLACGKGIAYYFNNHSLLRRALETKQLELYVHLKLKGYVAGPGEDSKKVKELLTKLDDREKEMIEDLILKLAIDQREDYPKILALKSCIHDRGFYKNNTDRKKHFEKIEEFFNELNKIDKIRPLLKVVAQFDVKFYFDFFEEYIHNMVVVDYDLKGEKGTWGMVFEDGKIIIGAKIKEIAIRTLAHEMCHIAMRYVYGNKWLPYNDTTSGDDFDRVYRDCCELYLADENISDDIVPLVFTDYDNDEWLRKVELIVRAPEMYAYFHNSPKLTECRVHYKRLFEYYDNKVVQDLENFNAKSIQITRNVNLIFDDLWNINLELKNYVLLNTVRVNLENMNEHVLKTKAPKIALMDIYERSKNYYNYFFVNPEMFKREKIRTYYEEFITSTNNPKVIVDLSDGFSSELMQEISTSNVKFIIVTHPENEVKIQEVLGNSPSYKPLTYYWSDLTADSQLKIKSKLVNFQHVEKKLMDIIKDDSIFDEEFIGACMLDILPVNDFDKIGGNEVHIDRHLSEKSALEMMAESVMKLGSKKGGKVLKEDSASILKIQNIPEKEIVSKCTDTKFVIISSTAGNGKSQTLKKIQPFIDGLVYRIDLIDYLETLKNIGQSVNFKEFFSRHLMNNKTTFERKIFEHLYNKTTVLFDGFDEISPECQDQVLLLINSFKGKQLWITTRDYLEVELWDNLRGTCKVLTFEALTSEQRIDFFVQYLKDKKIEEEDLQLSAKMLDRKLQEGSSEPIGVPQLLKLFADACIVDNKIDINSLNQIAKLKIYQESLEKKIEHWSEKIDKKMARKAQACDESFARVHRFHALQIALPDLDLREFEISIKRWGPNDITKCGVITRFVGDRPIFQHLTLENFYTADFIVDGLKRSNKCFKNYFQTFMRLFCGHKNSHVFNMFVNDGLKDHEFSKENIAIITECIENIIACRSTSFAQLPWFNKPIEKFDSNFFTIALLNNYDTLFELFAKVFSGINNPKTKLTQLEDELSHRYIKFKNSNDINGFRRQIKKLIEKEITSKPDKTRLNSKVEDLAKKGDISHEIVTLITEMKADYMKNNDIRSKIKTLISKIEAYPELNKLSSHLVRMRDLLIEEEKNPYKEANASNKVKRNSAEIQNFLC